MLLNNKLVRKQLNLPLLLAIIFPGLYLCDLLYGALITYSFTIAISPGQAFRGGFLLIAGLTFGSMLLERRDPYVWFLSMLLAAIAPSILFFSNTIELLLYEISTAARVLYGPFMILLIREIIRTYQPPAKQVIVYFAAAGHLLCLSLLLFSALKLGDPTYGPWAFGFKGLFFAQNDIGLAATLGISAAAYLSVWKPGLPNFILLLASMAGLAALGTRTAMAAPALVAISISFVSLYAGPENWNTSRKKVSLSVCILVMSGLAVSTTSFLIATGGLGDKGSDYQASKIERTLGGELGRKRLMEVGLKSIKDRPAHQAITGEGAYSYRMKAFAENPYAKEGDQTIAEMDWLDLFAQYGLIFTVMVYGLYGYLLMKAILEFLCSRSALSGLLATMLGMYLCHSVIAGHALISPIVSTIPAGVAALLLFPQSLD